MRCGDFFLQKNMEKKVLFLICMAISATLGFLGGRNARKETVTVQVDTLAIRDTIVDYRPILKETRIIRKDTVRLVATDTLYIHDTVSVAVPITLDRYTTKDYDIAVSGFHTNLEYVKVFPETKIITKTVTESQRKFRFGLATGPSACLTPDGRFAYGLGITGGVLITF